MQQNYALPALYAPWITELFPGPIPQETRATCQECIMCSCDRPAADLAFFDPKVKCCTHEPRLANFLVGRILADDKADRAGRASVEDRIARQIAVSPLGLDTSARFNLLFGSAPHGFGRALAFRCPHYLESPDGGRCGIWAHRNSVCSTWFCKHVRGNVGLEFWGRLKELLGTIETELSLWCAAELEAGSRELLGLANNGHQHLDLAALEGPADTDRYLRLWGVWAGREREYYGACAELVSKLDWNDVLQRCGQQVRLRAQLAREAYDKLTSGELPARLRLVALKMACAQDGRMLVETYSSFDPLLMSERLVRALPYFTGQPWPEAVTTIHAQLGMRLDRNQVRRLVDFGILVGCQESTEP